MNNSYDVSHLLYSVNGVERRWLMSHAERAAVLHVLQISQPVAALEVGTDQGGCLQHIRRFAKKTYSIDILPEVSQRLIPDMPEVEFLVGDSKQLIGRATSAIDAQGLSLGFVLIDGDHTFAGVKADLTALLTYRPKAPLWVLMHDSTNPGCREGIADAPWAENPHVHLVDLDFVQGALSESPDFHRMLWGGLGLALLLPEPRRHSLEIAASGAKTYEALFRVSKHNPTLINWVRNWIETKRRGLARRLQRSA